MQARNRQAMNEIRKVINWAQQAPTPAIAASGSPLIERPRSSHGKQHRQQQLALTAGGPDGAADTSDEGSSSSSDGRAFGSPANGQLSSGLPGPHGPDCLPLMLEPDDGAMLSGTASLLGGNRISEHSSASEGRRSTNDDGMVSASLSNGSKAKSSRSSNVGKHGSKLRGPEVDVSATDAGLQHDGFDYQDGLPYAEDSKGDIDTSR